MGLFFHHSRTRRRLLSTLTAVAVFSAVLVAASPVQVATAAVLSDDFNDNKRNPKLWNRRWRGTGATFAETSGRLEITIPATSSNGADGDFGAGYVSVCQLRGDFDIQVDFTLISWPFENGVRITLNAGPQIQSERVSWGPNEPTGSNRDVYLTHFDDGLGGLIAAGDSGGKLRLVRQGTTATGYYFSGGSWVAIDSGPVSSADGPAMIYAGSAEVFFGDKDVKLAFDNFVVNQGQIVCVPSVRSGQTFGRGLGTHGRNPSGSQSDPVNSATGSFVTSAADVSLPGIGLPFSLSRSYTSADTTQGALGVGWTHSYGVALVIQPNGDAILRAEDGQQILFERDPDGSFIPTLGALSTLSSVTGGYELLRLDQVRYSFNTAGRLTELRDRNGNKLIFSYDANGRLVQVTDTVGRSIAFTNNAEELLTGVALPDGRSVSYGYTSGRLTSVTELRSGTTSYSYGGGRLSQIIDANGHLAARNTYGTDGRVTEQLDALGNRSTFSWDAGTQTSTMTDARGGVWKDVYSNNVLVSRIDQLGKTVSFGRDSALNLVSITDRHNNTWAMTYDERGNLLTRTAPAPFSYLESFVYDAKNNLTSYTDGRQNATTFDYDGAGNPIKVTRPGNTATLLGRDSSGKGLLVSLTDPRGKTTSFGYDSSGNLTEITTPLGFKTTMGYDAFGRMTSMVEPRGNVSGANPADFRWSYSYDAADHLLSETDPLGNQTSWTYDPVGNVGSRTDALGRVTNYGYNNADELDKVTAPDGTVTAYGYDGVGNLVSRTDAKGRITTYGYDLAARLTSVASPIGQRWDYEYDASGNLTKIVDANGNATADPTDGITRYSYDQIDRLTGIDYSDATPDVSFSYDANSNRIQMADGAGAETYDYDALDRLQTVTRGTQSFSYLYDAGGNITRRTYPDGAVIDYVYDDDGRLTSVTSGAETTSYSYDSAANLTQTALPASNGYLETKTFDRAGRLSEIRNAKAGSTLSFATYTYDTVGNPSKIVTQDATTTYRYDALDRLTTECFVVDCTGIVDPLSIRYGYDEVGNRSTETRATGTATYSYNAADQLLSKTDALGTTTYSYDQNGNQTQAGGRTFAFDLANRMRSTTDAGVTTTYSYDGDGKRLQASSGPAAADTTNYLWDPNASIPALAIERDGNNALLRRYVHGPDLVSATSGGTTSYFHYDGLGSVANVTDATGGTDWSYSYEPFGAARTEVRNDPMAADNRMKFTGEYQDPTGLYHLRARQYDPAAGRFLALDPLPASLTDPYVASYVYANNRPTVWVDPAGTCVVAPPVDTAACVVGGAVVITVVAIAVVGGAIIGGLLLANSVDDASARNPAQDKPLSKADIRKLEKAGYNIHELKGGKHARLRDLYKDRQGNVYVKPKGGKGPGEPTGINLREL